MEQCFQAARNECGLAQYEVRRYVGRYRHITLAHQSTTFQTRPLTRENGEPRLEYVNPLPDLLGTGAHR